jgi:hypothetical protein
MKMKCSMPYLGKTEGSGFFYKQIGVKPNNKLDCNFKNNREIIF